MQEQTQFETWYRSQFRTVWNLCLSSLNNPTDTEDAVQETFLRLAPESKRFSDEAHVKARLICRTGAKTPSAASCAAAEPSSKSCWKGAAF